MKRIMIIAALGAMLIGPLVANAQDYDRRGGNNGRWSRGDDRGPGRGNGQGRGEGRANGPGRGDGRWNNGNDPGGRYDPRPEMRRRQDPRNGPPPYAVQRNGRSWRQGELLPPMYRGDVVRDPGRFRLRNPPPGYDWVGVGPDIYLMQRSTGMVLDTIPGGF